LLKKETEIKGFHASTLIKLAPSMNVKSPYVLCVCAVGLAAGLSAAYLHRSKSAGVGSSSPSQSVSQKNSSPEQLKSYADRTLAQCAASAYHPACYDQAIPKLVDDISMQDTFKVLALVQSGDSSYLNCHVVAHFISQKETAKDPSRWKDVITECPSMVCSDGCLHGVLLQRYNREYLSHSQIEELIPDLQDVCEPRGTWHPAEVERTMCYHGIGHLSMYATNADVKTAIDICNRVGNKDDGRGYVETCLEGVFMSIFQPADPEGSALVKYVTPPKEGVDAFCARFKGIALDVCHRESLALFSQEVQTPAGLYKSFCVALLVSLRMRKFGNVGRVKIEVQAMNLLCAVQKQSMDPIVVMHHHPLPPKAQVKDNIIVADKSIYELLLIAIDCGHGRLKAYAC
jgi:hypothetical protein